MSGLRLALVGLGAVGLVLVVAAVVLAVADDHTTAPALDAAIIGAIMVTWIGTGLFAWSRRPHNRVGALMVGVGFSFFFVALQSSDAPFVHTMGLWLSSLFAPAVVHMLLAFPTGRIEGRGQRLAVRGFYVLAVLVPFGILLFREDCECGVETPRNVLLVADDPTAADAIEIAGSLIGAVGTIAVAWILVSRWRRASPAGRRALSPVLWTGATLVAALGALLALDTPGDENMAVEVANLLVLVTFAAVPFAFLLGLARSRAWRAGAVVDVLEALGEAPGDERMQRALAEAVGDPTLHVAYWRPDREHFVDLEGRPVTLPSNGDARTAYTVEREGRTVGALIYDPAANDDPEVVRTVGNAAALALDNARLDADLRARVAELSASRKRLLEVGMAERRRLERDLHDGAQQRLVSLSLQLGLVSAKLDRDPQGAKELLAAAREEARAALEDLRELARGIHPAVLTDRGLGAALESLADRAPLPVEVAKVPAERLPAPVEAAAYFVVAESLTNVSKYANASHAEVRVGTEHGFALIEVRDDGVGGADPSAGSGLRGLADRLAALDGRLEIESTPGRGTVVRARVPCPT